MAREAAFFDLDKTVIARAAMAAFRGPLHYGGLLSRRSLLQAGLAQLVYLHLGASEQRLERIRGSVLRLTKGWEREQVISVVAETLELVVDPIIYAEAMDLIERHHAEGRLVVLVSASPEELVVPLGHHIGVDEAIATRAALDEQGRYTGEMAFYAYGPFKAAAMQEMAERLDLDLARSYAYSDSASDLPMLEAVGNPVAVNPDRVLARVARERGYEVLHFVRPVPLAARMRHRVRATQVRPAVAVSFGALTLAACALVLGWWIGSREARRYRSRRRAAAVRYL
ncbi:MAG: HAD-superfamily subfamily hydrolase [Acidimicrobiaceae bacterium]|nr:HAD-superfamily subfamily hydrolase [Acidimicrobiaceae bacterium]